MQNAPPDNSNSKLSKVRPDVLLYARKPRSVGNHSIELIDHVIVRNNTNRLNISRKTAPAFSSGLWNRVKILFDAWKQCAKILHITGDIYYAGIITRRRSLVCTIHDCGFLRRPAGLNRLILKWLWLTLPARSATAVVTVSSSSKADIEQNLGGKCEKIHVIPCPLPQDCIPMPKPFLNSYPTILQIGTAPNKNLSKLLVSLSGIACNLVVVGPMTKAQCKIAIQHKIMFKSYDSLPRSELIKAYYDSDILTLCSTYEGFGMPIIEAQAIGRIVVTSNRSSMPEVAGEGGAIFVDPDSVESIRQGILLALTDERLRMQLLANGLKNARRFDEKVVAQQYYDLYSKIMG